MNWEKVGTFGDCEIWAKGNMRKLVDPTGKMPDFHYYLKGG